MSGNRICTYMRTALFLLLLLLSNSLVSEQKQALSIISFVDPPYVFDDAQQEKGLVEIIISELFQRAGMEYDFYLMPKKRALIFAEKTPNTCVLPIERNQEREVKFTWISPILISRNGLFQTIDQHLDRKIITLMDAQPYRIGSHLGSASGAYLKGMGFEVEIVAKNSANIHKLRAGRIDFWETDAVAAHYISHTENIEIKKSALDFFTHLRAIGCNLSISPAVIKNIRKHLKQMYRDGSIDKINQEFMP